MPSRLAEVIARNEGFGYPGAIPTRQHNPGDLRHSPHSSHPVDAPNAIGTIDSDSDGWSDLERQLAIYAARGLTLRELAYTYAPPGDGNPTEAYLASICTALHLPESALVADALGCQ